VGFRDQRLRVFERPYRPPVFWMVAPRDAEATDAGDYLTDRHRPFLTRASRALLDIRDLRQHGVARSVVDSELLIVRRFTPDDRDARADVPRYLLVPGRPAGRTLPVALSARDRWLRENLSLQEDRMRRLVTGLAEFEAEAAARLFDIESDLEILDNHLSVYGEVANRGGVLWDGMAAHLLHHRGRQLAKVHRSIELVHQTLLQGVADVDAVRTEVDQRRSRITQAGDGLRARMENDLREAPLPNAPHLVDAVTRAGLFAGVSRRADEIKGVADRVAQDYRDLVQAIADAFDERRVRETDMLQRTTFAVGLTLGLVGIVTVLDTTIDLQVQWLDPGLTGALYTVRLIGLLLLVVLAAGLVKWVRLGHLGSKRYRSCYREVWDVLRFCSTDHLQTVAERIDRDHDAPPVPHRPGVEELDELSAVLDRRRRAAAFAWDRLDRHLARRYAQAWDRVSTMPGDVRHDAADAVPTLRDAPLTRAARRRAILRARDNLASMIEKWSLRTFLVTERPRAMWRLGLPRLTMLYTGALQTLGRSDIHVISTIDFFFVFGGADHSFTWNEAEALRHWLDRTIRLLRKPPKPDGTPREVPAEAVLDRIEALGIDARTRERKAEILRRIGRTAPLVPVFAPATSTDPASWRLTPIGDGPLPQVVYSPDEDSHLVVGHDAAEQVLRCDVEGERALSPADARRSRRALCPAALDPPPPPNLLVADGRYIRRRARHQVDELITRLHTPRHEAALRADVGLQVRRATSPVELVSAVLRPTTRQALRLTLRLTLQFSAAETDHLAGLAHSARRLASVELGEADQTQAAQDLMAFHARLRAVADRMPSRLRGDLHPDDTVMTLAALLLSGPETLTALLGNSIWHLLKSGLWSIWEAETGKREALVEECLRFATPVVFWRREAVRAHAVGRTDEASGGATVVPAGARLLVGIAAANRDPAVFKKADEFRIDAPSDGHLTFGRGDHACPAEALVRRHLRIVLDVLADRLPGLQLDHGHPPTFSDDLTLRGPTTLHVRWTP
jgi:cytochrome P450